MEEAFFGLSSFVSSSGFTKFTLPFLSLHLGSTSGLGLAEGEPDGTSDGEPEGGFDGEIDRDGGAVGDRVGLRVGFRDGGAGGLVPVEVITILAFCTDAPMAPSTLSVRSTSPLPFQLLTDQDWFDDREVTSSDLP